MAKEAPHDRERKSNDDLLPTRTDEEPKRPSNPYSLKRSKMEQIRITDFKIFVELINGHVNTILRHDPGQKSAAWYGLWKQWLDDDLSQATTLHMISVVIDFPPKEKKTHKSVSRFILEHLSVLDRYLHVPGQTRDDDPLVKITACYILLDSKFPSYTLIAMYIHHLIIFQDMILTHMNCCTR